MNEDGKGYKILKMDDIVGLLATDENAKYADISQRIFNQFKLNKYDVLFNRVNSDEFVGRTGIYLLDGEHTFASYLVRITSEYTYQNCYLNVFLNCSYGYHALQRVKRRAVNQANINAQELKDLVVPYPNENFQKTIEKLVVHAQTLKIDSEKYYKKSEEILLRELGINDWTDEMIYLKFGKTRIESCAVASEKLKSDIFKNNRMDGEFWFPKYEKADNYLQNNGKSMPLGKIAGLKKGVQARDQEDGGIPYASIKDCKKLSIITNEFTNSDKTVIAAPGDIVMAITGATIGKVALNDTQDYIAISGDLLKISAEGVSNYYLLAILASPLIQNLAVRYTTGATNGHLSPKDVSNFPIPILHPSYQKKLNRYIS
jgi:restriction endonuclease S subunit